MKAIVVRRSPAPPKYAKSPLEDAGDFRFCTACGGYPRPGESTNAPRHEIRAVIQSTATAWAWKCLLRGTRSASAGDAASPRRAAEARGEQMAAREGRRWRTSASIHTLPRRRGWALRRAIRGRHVYRGILPLRRGFWPLSLTVSYSLRHSYRGAQHRRGLRSTSVRRQPARAGRFAFPPRGRVPGRAPHHRQGRRRRLTITASTSTRTRDLPKPAVAATSDIPERWI